MYLLSLLFLTAVHKAHIHLGVATDVLGLPWWLSGKGSIIGDKGSIPRYGRSPGEGNGNPLQYSYLGNPMEPGELQSMGLQESWTRPSNWTVSMVDVLPSSSSKVSFPLDDLCPMHGLGKFHSALTWQPHGTHPQCYQPARLLCQKRPLDGPRGTRSSLLPAHRAAERHTRATV